MLIILFFLQIPLAVIYGKFIKRDNTKNRKNLKDAIIWGGFVSILATAATTYINYLYY